MSRRGSKTYTYTKNKDSPVIRFRLKAAFFIIFVVYVLCFIIYMTESNINSKKINYIGFSSNSSELSTDEEIPEPTEPSEKEIQIINPVPESDMLTETYFSKCMFVGDSISVGLGDYQFVPVKNVLAEIGMNIEKINTETMSTTYGEMTALDAIKEEKPENIYIMLGSNGIAWLTVTDIIKYYSEFVDEIIKELPNTKIYIISIPPVTTERETAEDQPILNSDIDKYNSELLKMANEKKIYYVDINTALKGNDGKFPSDMAEEDGMHFVKTTYPVMLDYILSHTVK